MKKKSVLITIATILCLTLSIGMLSMAAEPTTFNSKGKIVFDNSTPETTDDVIFDASDLTTLDTMVSEGKEGLVTSLNQYPNTNVTTLSTFLDLSTAIDNLTAVPDIYYYDKATEGDSCVRYMYEDGSYYPCNEYGEKISDEALTGTITVVTKDDTTEPAEGEVQLVKYESTNAANLSAGSAGYADKTFVLGSGSDNITYQYLSFYNYDILFARAGDGGSGSSGYSTWNYTYNSTEYQKLLIVSCGSAASSPYTKLTCSTETINYYIQDHKTSYTYDGSSHTMYTSVAYINEPSEGSKITAKNRYYNSFFVFGIKK